MLSNNFCWAMPKRYIWGKTFVFLGELNSMQENSLFDWPKCKQGFLLLCKVKGSTTRTKVGSLVYTLQLLLLTGNCRCFHFLCSLLFFIKYVDHQWNLLLIFGISHQSILLSSTLIQRYTIMSVLQWFNSQYMPTTEVVHSTMQNQ